MQKQLSSRESLYYRYAHMRSQILVIYGLVNAPKNQQNQFLFAHHKSRQILVKLSIMLFLVRKGKRVFIFIPEQIGSVDRLQIFIHYLRSQSSYLLIINFYPINLLLVINIKNRQTMQEYSQTYAELGHLLVKAKIAESIPNRCAELLPHNFRAVDLGSNGTKFADRLMDLCHRSGKAGTCLSVDPFPTSPEVIKMTSEEFIETQDDSSLDLALCQYSVHFNKDQPSFFRKMYQKLKPNGNFIICQVGNDVKLPWTDPIFRNFKKEYIKAADIIPRNIFQWTIQNERFEVKMAKSQFRKLIQKRGWSNLLSNTKQEIEQCLNNIDSIKEDILTCESSVWVYNLTKLKHGLHS